MLQKTPAPSSSGNLSKTRNSVSKHLSDISVSHSSARRDSKASQFPSDEGLKLSMSCNIWVCERFFINTLVKVLLWPFALGRFRCELYGMTAAPSIAAQKAKNQEIGVMTKSHKKEYISLAASSSPFVTRKIPMELAPKRPVHTVKKYVNCPSKYGCLHTRK